MKISDFKKLEKKINGQNFTQGYKNINYVMLVLSVFGHIASIFLAYFMLSKILSAAVNNNPVFVFITSVVLLGGLELLKREIFDKFSIGFIKAKSLTKDVMPLFLISLAIVSTSFYASITGAKEFSSKADIIDSNKNKITIQVTDSINKVYNDKIIVLNGDMKATKDKIDLKDKEQTDLEAIQPPTKSQKSRIKDLKDEKATLREDVVKIETDINSIKAELAEKVNSAKTEIVSDTDDKKRDNRSNSLAFVLISSLIEIIILLGVYFNEYYKYRTYNDFRNKIENDTNYQKWLVFDKMLDIIYPEDAKLNQKLPSNKIIIDLCKINDVIVLPKDIVNFLKIMNSLGIIKTSGSSRYINKNRDISFESLRNHFNVE